MERLTWSRFALLSLLLIIAGALAGALLGKSFPEASPLWILPTCVAVGFIVGLAVKKNSRRDR